MRAHSIRPRQAADLAGCVAALAGVHEADRYPVRWPDDPRGWLTPPDMLGAWVATDEAADRRAHEALREAPHGSADRSPAGPAILGHIALTRCGPDLAETIGAPAAGLATVSRLFVSVTARRDGWARRLLTHAAQAATGLGLRAVLEVEAGAAPAIALYERAGWQYTGSMTGHWTAPNGLPAVVRAYLGPRSG